MKRHIVITLIVATYLYFIVRGLMWFISMNIGDGAIELDFIEAGGIFLIGLYLIHRMTIKKPEKAKAHACHTCGSDRTAVTLRPKKYQERSYDMASFDRFLRCSDCGQHKYLK